MLILWIRKNKADKHNYIEGKEGQSFQEHDDIMKKFRLAHPDIAMSLPKAIMAEEENALEPMQQVKLPVNIQN